LSAPINDRWRGYNLIENVENFVEERFLTPPLVVGYAAVTISVVSGFIAIIQVVVLALFRIGAVPRISLLNPGRAVGPLDDFVQFTPVEPDSSALRTVVNFDILSFSNLKIYITYWATHALIPFTYITLFVVSNLSDLKRENRP
jgi:hypothetical protein